ncbi:MAG: hypothetical protein L3K19_01370 [Thermoplasmata archaeon]|nr:hypothetical protein [Thermoplasmata archaeon]
MIPIPSSAKGKKPKPSAKKPHPATKAKPSRPAARPPAPHSTKAPAKPSKPSPKPSKPVGKPTGGSAPAKPPAAPVGPPRSPDARRHVLSLSFLRDGDEFMARLETDAGQITELKNRSLDQLLTLVANELEDLLE